MELVKGHWKDSKSKQIQLIYTKLWSSYPISHIKIGSSEQFWPPSYILFSPQYWGLNLESHECFQSCIPKLPLKYFWRFNNFISSCLHNVKQLGFVIQYAGKPLWYTSFVVQLVDNLINYIRWSWLDYFPKILP